MSLSALLALTAALGPQSREGPPGTVLVPGGRTKIGTEVGDLERLIASDSEAQGYAGALWAETPRHEVDVESFWAMTSEVTNEQYALYVSSTGARPPRHWTAARANDEAALVPAGEGPLPVVFVDWQDAQGYARWAGLRLLSELEYQRAVRGESARSYPWGNEWEDGKHAASGTFEHKSGAVPVGSFPSGASRQGVFDLAGNVWEWTSSRYLPFPGYEARVLEVGYGPARRSINAIADWNGDQRVVVGGSFQNGAMMARATTRRAAERLQAADALGFRCAASLRPGFDAAVAILDGELTPNVRPISGGRMVEYAPGRTTCADGWATAPAGTIGPSTDGSRKAPAGYAVIAGYACVLFTPVREVPAHDLRGLDKLASSQDLVPLGFFSTDMAVIEPDLPPGTYEVSWRAKGVRPRSAKPEQAPEEAPLEETLRLDVTRNHLVFVDVAGRPALAQPCELEWETARESRVTWVDAATRLLRFELCVPCRGQKGFTFPLALRLAPDEPSVTWRPR